MAGRRVIVAVDRKQVHDLDGLLKRLETLGFELDDHDTLLELTHIVGYYDGDLSALVSDGITARESEWKGQMESGDAT